MVAPAKTPPPAQMRFCRGERFDDGEEDDNTKATTERLFVRRTTMTI